MAIQTYGLETLDDYGVAGWSAIHDANIEKLDKFKGLTTSQIFHGLQIENNGSNPNYQLDIATGICASSDGLDILEVATPITADITADLDTGSEAADTIYYLFVIYNPTSGITKGLFSLSRTSPSLPAGFTKKRLVGAVKNNALSNFLRIKSVGDLSRRKFKYIIPQIILAGGGATSWTTVDLSGYIPESVIDIDYIILAFTTSTPGNITVNLRTNGESSIQRAVYGYSQLTNMLDLECDNNRLIQYYVGEVTTIAYIVIAAYWEDL